MRLKLVGGAGAVLVLALVLILLLLPDEKPDQPAASISVPTAGELPEEQTPRSMTTAPSFILPADPISPPAPAPSSAPPSGPSASPPARPATQPQPQATASGRISFYGARNNSPPGSRAIAYTDVLHGQAGGSGTFDDPITFAAGTDRYKPGTKIYIPDLKRYFILEDLCPQCSGGTINVWTGAAADSGSTDCQRSLSRDQPWAYEIGPPAGRPVVPGDLYRNGRCFQP